MRGVAPRLIALARRRTALSQAELARRAGVPRSVLNAYERGHRQPGADMLARILEAAGFTLSLREAPRPVDPERAGRILAQVLELADALPHRRPGGLRFPPFRKAVA